MKKKKSQASGLLLELGGEDKVVVEQTPQAQVEPEQQVFDPFVAQNDHF